MKNPRINLLPAKNQLQRQKIRRLSKTPL